MIPEARIWTNVELWRTLPPAGYGSPMSLKLDSYVSLNTGEVLGHPRDRPRCRREVAQRLADSRGLLPQLPRRRRRLFPAFLFELITRSGRTLLAPPAHWLLVTGMNDASARAPGGPRSG